MKTVGIVACSNAQKKESKIQNQSLVKFLERAGNRVLVSKYIYEKTGIFSGSGKERAGELMNLFMNPDVTDIYDISGGDMANEILDELDFEKIKNSKAVLWGYSDLTTVMNAIYSQTGKSSVLYSVKNLLYEEIQRHRYFNQKELFSPSFQIVQGKRMKGIVIGGNIRCFLKLAGTKYFPDATDKILLLEARSGKVPQMITYLSQLKSCGVFQKIKGVLLGTFCEMEEEQCKPDMVTLIQKFVGKDLPVARTNEIGHYHDSKAIWIGKDIEINSDRM